MTRLEQLREFAARADCARDDIERLVELADQLKVGDIALRSVQLSLLAALLKGDAALVKEEDKAARQTTEVVG